MNELILWNAILLAGCAGVCLAVGKHYQKKTGEILQNVLQKLDRALSGEIQDTVYDETMDAAITERLNQVLQSTEINRKRAEKERDYIQSLVSDISHQTKTSLSNIMLYTGLLREQELSPRTRILVDKIGNQSEKLTFFMEELVNSSYAEREMIGINQEQVMVSEIVDTACQMQELFAIKKKIIVQKKGEDDCCYADKKWTIEAVSNVLDNAIKYSPVNSVIEIKTVAYESFVCIEVIDSGIGIREDEQGMIYERFYRSPDVKQEPGVGIGLYLLREVLSKQGGYSKIKSAKGQGTSVRIFLPRRAMH